LSARFDPSVYADNKAVSVVIDMKKLFATLLAVTMLLSLSACGTPSGTGSSSVQETVKNKYFTFAASPATAAMYPYWVAIGQAVHNAYPEMQVSVSESQGATDISNRIRAGEADLGNSASPSDWDNYYGTGSFDTANSDARMLWYYDAGTCCLFAVAEDSGVISFEDLNGQKINPGGTGTTVAQLAIKAFDILGITPNWFEAGKSDAADAYGNRQIIGVCSGTTQPDTYIIQLQASRGLRILSFTDEQLDKIIAEMPYLTKVTIPAGTYEGVDYDVKTYCFSQGAQSSTALSQEDGYKICKAVFDTQRSVWEAAMPNLADNDLIAYTLNSAIPLHAGTVQYLMEQGCDIPEDLIPPEYKAVS